VQREAVGVARTNTKESDLAGMTVVELRQMARDRGVSGTSGMRKDELVKAIASSMAAGRRGAAAKRPSQAGAGARAGAKAAAGKPSTGRAGAAKTTTGAATTGGARRGKSSSRSLKYAQEIRSVDDLPMRPGRSLVTTDHQVIQRWAQQREAAPATVPGTEHDGHVGVLRLDFPGYGGRQLQHISWDQWFDSFDQRGLNFIYQEKSSNGRPSNFFVLENPGREDG
jgi:hypothetical protein